MDYWRRFLGRFSKNASVLGARSHAINNKFGPDYFGASWKLDVPVHLYFPGLPKGQYTYKPINDCNGFKF